MLEFGDISGLTAACRRGTVRLDDVADAVYGRGTHGARPEVWLHRPSRDALQARANELEAGHQRGESLPLLGVPFAVKDNIDVAGVPTTAGCPAFAYTPERSAPVVERLLAAGAIYAGKTHMDQFATGLVGTRAPVGPCRNAYDARVISGGSSSGSAVAVALDLVGFALGTDTAGSGRVPAALSGIVGLKPSLGRLSTEGVVPACRSFDCVSVFARGVASAHVVARVAEGFAPSPLAPTDGPFDFGVPGDDFLGALAPDVGRALEIAIAELERMGGSPVTVQGDGLAEAAALLYDGPFVHERHDAVGAFVAEHRAAVDPTVGAIIAGAGGIPTAAIEAGWKRLEVLRREALGLFQGLACLVVPTLPRRFGIAEVQADPIATNSTLGRFTNFMNLLDLCGLAVPVAPATPDVPTGVTLAAPSGHDETLAALGARLEAALPPVAPPAASVHRTWIPLCVVGAHLRGMPLNGQLLAEGGEFVRTARTSSDYRLWHLADSSPPKPGLERVERDGAALEAEVWALPADGFARFADAVPRPLGIGHVTLEDGATLAGFICEPEGLRGARDVTEHGGWRRYLERRSTRT